MEYNFCSCPLMTNINISTKVVPRSFALALTVSEKLSFKIFDLQKVGQAHGVKLRNDAI